MSDEAKKVGQRGKNIKGKAPKARRKPTQNEVRDYLIQNPGFFDLNCDLLALLKPARPKRTDGVLDFQAVLLDRLQNEVATLSDIQGSLIHASRSNMTTQARIHGAVLFLLEAETFNHLCHIVCFDWIDLLQVDTISICFEGGPPNSLPENSDIRRVKKGVINGYLGRGNDAVLHANVKASQEIFGPATPLIKAEALIRVKETPQHPVGLLAFGSRDKDFFAPGQGTELLRFMEAAFSACLTKILKSTD